MSGYARVAMAGLAAALILTSCTETVYEVVPVAGVEVTGMPAHMEVGESAQLGARVVCASGRTLPDRLVTWTSSNPSVAGVDSEGRVTAVSPGSVEVHATCEGVSGSASTTAVVPIEVGDWGFDGGAGLSGWFRVVAGSRRVTEITLGYDEWQCGGLVVKGLEWSATGWDVTAREVDLQLGSGDNATRFNGAFSAHGATLDGAWSATKDGRSCSGSWNATVTPPGTVGARLGFAYSGHRSDIFSVVATFKLNLSGEENWAVTFYDSEYDTQDLMAVRTRSDGLLDVILFWVPGRVTQVGTRSPSGGVFYLGYNPDTKVVTDAYGVTSGSVTFALLDGSHYGGSFSLGLSHLDHGASLTISSATFNVPLLTMAPGSEPLVRTPLLEKPLPGS